jgi:glycosyltransferase involved in cell wall biosynthesis
LITQSAAGIPNGIILTDWLKINSEDIREGRKLLERILPGKSKYVVFIGRADYRKGLDALIEAFGMLPNLKEYGLIVGSVLTGEEYSRLFSLAQRFQAQDSVLLYSGWLEEKMKKQMFCASDVICLPSLYEPFGLVTLEGLAADLACQKNGVKGPVVIVGDTGGMHEVIRNGVNGFKSPMEQDRFILPPAYLSKILKLALKDDALCARISDGGAQRVQSTYFDWGHISLMIMEAYRKASANYNKWNTGGKAGPAGGA